MEVYASFTLACSRSRVFSSLVLQVAYWFWECLFNGDKVEVT